MSRENILSLFMAMRFSGKLSYLSRLIRNNGPVDLIDGKFDRFHPNTTLTGQEYLNQLIDAMTTDLAHEHRAVRMYKNQITGRELERQIWNLRKLARLQTPYWMTPETALGKALVRLASGIKFLLWSENSWLTQNTFQSDVFSYSNSFLNRFIDVAFGGIAHPVFNEEFRDQSALAIKLDRNEMSKLPWSSSENIALNKKFRSVIDSEYGMRVQYSNINFKGGRFSFDQMKEFRFQLLTNPLGKKESFSLKNIVSSYPKVISIKNLQSADKEDSSDFSIRNSFEELVKSENDLIINKQSDQKGKMK